MNKPQQTASYPKFIQELEVKYEIKLNEGQLSHCHYLSWNHKRPGKAIEEYIQVLKTLSTTPKK